MTPIFKNHGATIIYVITAIAIVVSALLLKDTEYENAWLYILALGFVLVGIFELYSIRKDKDQ